MADESKLQIILEAVNETGSPFKDLNEAISAFQRSAEDLAKSISASFESMSKSASEAASGIEDSVKADSQAFQEIATSASEQAKLAEESLNEISKSATEMEKGVSEAASGVSEGLKSASASASEMEKGVSDAAAGVERGLKSASTSANDFERTTSEDFQNASREMDNLRSNMEKGVGEIGGLIAVQMLGQSMEELGKQGEHLFDFAIEQGSDFQQTMKNIQTVIATNITTHEAWNQKLKDSSSITEQLQQKALELGSRGAQSANEVGAAMDTMLRAGVDAKTVLNGAAESAQNVAIVTGDKLDESANLVTEIYHQFRESFAENGKSVQENMKETGDVLTGTLLSARINSQDFLDTLKYVGPVASQLGSSFLDTATATAVLAQNGIKGSQAGNNLKRALTSLLEPTKAGAAAMEHLGLIQHGHNMLIDESTGKMKNLTQIQDILHKSMDGLTEAQKAKYIHDMFGQYALAGTLVLANENSEAFSNLKEKIGGISAENAAASMLNTFSGHMAQLKAHVETTAKEFGMAFLPVLEKLIPIGQQFLNWLQSLSPSTKEFLMGILAAGSALAIVGGALATFAVSVKFAKDGLEMLSVLNPFKFLATSATDATVATQGLAVAEGEIATASELGAFGGMAGMFGKIAESAKSLGTGLSNLIIGPWKLMVDGVKNIPTLFGAIPGALSTAKEAVSGAVKAMADGFMSIIEAAPKVLSSIVSAFSWENILATAQKVWEGFTVAFQAGLDFMMGPWGILILTIMAGVGALIANWDTIKNWVTQHFGGTIPTTWKGLKDMGIQIFTELRNFFTQIWNDIKKVITDVWNYISPTITGAIKKIQTFWNQVWPEIKQLFVEVWNVMKIALAPAAAAIGTIIVAALGFIKGAWRDGWNAIKDALKLAWDLITGIIRTAFDVVTGVFKVALDILTGHWSKAWNDAKSLLGNVWGDIKKLFGNFVNDALSFGKDLVMGIANGIEGAIGSVISAAQKVVSAITGIFSSAPKAPSVSGGGGSSSGSKLSIPAMAEGGMVNKPTLALIGEAGPEVVVPLNKLPAMPAVNGYREGYMPPVLSGGRSSSGIVINIGNISGNIAQSQQQLAETISTHIVNKMKWQGHIG